MGTGIPIFDLNGFQVFRFDFPPENSGIPNSEAEFRIPVVPEIGIQKRNSQPSLFVGCRKGFWMGAKIFVSHTFMWEANIFAPIWSRPWLSGFLDGATTSINNFFWCVFYPEYYYYYLHSHLSQQMRELDRLFLPFYQATLAHPPPVWNQAKTRWVRGITPSFYQRQHLWYVRRLK